VRERPEPASKWPHPPFWQWNRQNKCIAMRALIGPFCSPISGAAIAPVVMTFYVAGFSRGVSIFEAFTPPPVSRHSVSHYVVVSRIAVQYLVTWAEFLGRSGEIFFSLCLAPSDSLRFGRLISFQSPNKWLPSRFHGRMRPLHHELHWNQGDPRQLSRRACQ